MVPKPKAVLPHIKGHLVRFRHHCPENKHRSGQLFIVNVIPRYAYLTVGIPHSNYSMRLSLETHFPHCLHLFASSIIECSWSRRNSNWKVNTSTFHRWPINTQTVSQCVRTLAFETFENIKKRHTTRISVQKVLLWETPGLLEEILKMH